MPVTSPQGRSCFSTIPHILLYAALPPARILCISEAVFARSRSTPPTADSLFFRRRPHRADNPRSLGNTVILPACGQKNMTYKKGIPLFHPRGNGLKSAAEREKRFETVRTHLLFFAVLSLFVMFVPCPSSTLFGIPCPLCGMTRAWIGFLKGDIAAAFALHPLFICFPFVLIFFCHIRILTDKIGKTVTYVAAATVAAAFLVAHFLRDTGILSEYLSRFSDKTRMIRRGRRQSELSPPAILYSITRAICQSTLFILSRASTVFS